MSAFDFWFRVFLPPLAAFLVTGLVIAALLLHAFRHEPLRDRLLVCLLGMVLTLFPAELMKLWDALVPWDGNRAGPAQEAVVWGHGMEMGLNLYVSVFLLLGVVGVVFLYRKISERRARKDLIGWFGLGMGLGILPGTVAGMLS
ncbi:MAG: hypothetical protein ACK4RW_13110 [Rehaibacterium terrae]|uniref:hypothetical protein n=1 Tax=Rehaibacterium terrae TaxID=1341696 RepID=UPI00391B2724